MRYRGRFAPSPTGPLHFGSLITAAGSWLDARAHAGSWLLRMEDIDLPRNVPGAAEQILRTLESCGLCWDGPVEYQSRRTPLYDAALRRLRDQGDAFGCCCSRKEAGEGVYSGACRAGLPAGREARAWRVRVPAATVGFDDRRAGPFAQDLAGAVGDFVVRRADGLFAYQLAVVVDDEDQRITDVVRGEDLLDSTPRQILLQRLLGYATPRYLHLPLALNESGEKLSKQTRAPAAGKESLPRALRFLGLPLPLELEAAPPPELLHWAVNAWRASRLR
jgi:glutamyl-Q tRNA(Asp) synthetase